MPKLTSIGPHKDSMARKALSAMIEAIKGKRTSLEVKSQLVERDSVAVI